MLAWSRSVCFFQYTAEVYESWPDLRLPSHPQGITVFWPVPINTAWYGTEAHVWTTCLKVCYTTAERSGIEPGTFEFNAITIIRSGHTRAGDVSHGSRVTWVMGLFTVGLRSLGRGSSGSWVTWVMGHMSHGSVHWWFTWVMGHVDNGSVYWRVRYDTIRYEMLF